MEAPDWYHMDSSERIDERSDSNFRIVLTVVTSYDTEKHFVFHILPEIDIQQTLQLPDALYLLGLAHYQNCPFDKKHLGCYSYHVPAEVGSTDVIDEMFTSQRIEQLNVLHDNLTSAVQALQSLHQTIQKCGLPALLFQE